MKKRILALMMAAMLTMGMSMTAFAAGNYSIKIEQIEGTTEKHTYEAYQIFKGKLSEDGKTLSNIEWGYNMNASAGVEFKGATYTDASVLAEALMKEDDAKEFATVISKYIINAPVATATEDNAGAGVTLSGLEDGYYFVKDKDKSLDGTADSYSRYMIQIAGNNVTVTAKADVPSTEKKVQDKNDSEPSEKDANWYDSADYDIGDEIPFKFESTIVDNIEDYKEYYYTFHDVQSKGLTFKDGSVKVSLFGNEYPEGKEIEYGVTTNTIDGCTFEVKTENLSQVAQKGDKVVVEYVSILNENANIGSLGNTNKMYLEFSNNPNGEGTGKTPEDEVVVFTYKVLINKVDEFKKPLDGAEFTLKKLMDKEYVTIFDAVKATPVYEQDEEGNDVVDENGNKIVKSYTFSFKGLDDGIYRLEETKTPDGYNTMKPVDFKIVAVHTNGNAGEIILSDLAGKPITGSIDLGFSVSKEEGSLVADVVNKQGSLLPSTGGIGTTIFYVIGGALVIGAGVVLFARKRMSYED